MYTILLNTNLAFIYYKRTVRKICINFKACKIKIINTDNNRSITIPNLLGIDRKIA